MAIKTKIHPLFFAPFVSSPMKIEPEWIDSYGHLNMAYYHVIFERGIDEALKMIGITPEYDTERGFGIFTAECHIHYRRDVLLETPAPRHRGVACRHGGNPVSQHRFGKTPRNTLSR